MGKIYLAYGSNMSVEQMTHRCPEAKLLEVTMLPGFRLAFTGAPNRSYATIQKDDTRQVPVLLWEISQTDEASLDRYEDYPNFYEKAEIELNGQTVMYYYMVEQYGLGLPSDEYYNIIAAAYDKFDFDKTILETALKESQNVIKS